MVAALPEQRRERLDARFKELKDGGSRAPRRGVGKAQAAIASIVKIKQPSVSKIEKQAEICICRHLKSFVEAIGGQLDLIVASPRSRAV
ncbi:hypothetical protein [Mesorhizobium caraganae]|uniref:hypothetical protein n=1 Tax=Mesorhizobium caraganae TaxID=483206 RepID=UPI003ECF0F66